MLLEIRRYSIEPGRRDEFVEWFEASVVPAMEEASMQIVGQFVSLEDPNAFFYLRAFTDERERDLQYRAFYESPLWLDELKDRALEMETGFKVEVVAPTPGSRLR